VLINSELRVVVPFAMHHASSSAACLRFGLFQIVSKVYSYANVHLNSSHSLRCQMHPSISNRTDVKGENKGGGGAC
jgi:hypothetical protein